MGNKKTTRLLAIILLVVSACSFSMGMLLQYNIINFNSDNNQDNKEQKDNETVKVEEELDLKDGIIEKLLTVIKGKNNLSSHKYLPQYMDSFFYKINEETSVDKIANDDLLKLVWLNLKDTSDKTDVEGGFTVSVDTFKKKYESIFGPNLVFSKDTTSTSADACLKVNYNTANDNYEFYDTCTSDSNIEVIPKVVRAVKSNKELKIYEQVAFYSDNILYGDIDLRKEITKEYDESKFEQYGKSLNTYIYTFNVGDNGNYYFSKIDIEK